MPLNLSIQKDKKLSTDVYEFFMLRLAGINDQTLVVDVLSLLLALPYSRNQLILNPIPSEWTPKVDANKFYALTPNLRLNTLFGEKASFAQQMLFLNLMGLTDKIERRPDLREAVEFFKFQKKLLYLGIENPNISCPDAISLNIKRIHLVLPEYLEDPEISAGLHISVRKNREDNQVLFVCNIKSLRMALELCNVNSTLILDGHWLHGCTNDYGVWTRKKTEQICEEIKILIDDFPRKVSSIRLLGCHSGKLLEHDKLTSIYHEENFIFKDKVIEGFNRLEMSLFRNRAVYFSQAGESPFLVDSLAGQIFEKIKDSSIRLTAPPALTYPYPSGVAVSEFNIGADSNKWTIPPSWNILQSYDLPWFMKLNCLRSLTIINKSEQSYEINSESGWLRKI